MCLCVLRRVSLLGHHHQRTHSFLPEHPQVLVVAPIRALPFRRLRAHQAPPLVLSLVDGAESEPLLLLLPLPLLPLPLLAADAVGAPLDGFFHCCADASQLKTSRWLRAVHLEEDVAV